MSERKVFSEQEVSAVVRRAVELQETAGKESYTPGVTPDELARIAGELGIEPKFLQQAIDEANSTESKRGPLHLTEEFERVVDVELAPEDYDVLLRYLKPAGNRGGFTQIGKTLSGTTWTGCSMAHVEVTSKRGRTRINVKSNALFAWLVSLHPATLASFGLLGGLGSTGRIWLALAIVSAIWAVAIIAFKSLLEAGHRSARRLTDNLARSVSDSGEDLRSRLASTSATTIEQTKTVETKA